MQDFKKLQIWTESKDLSLKIYKLTQKFPREERYGITSQLRRSSISVSANIAEGSGRHTSKDFRNFINIAMGSLFELENYIIIALELSYISEEDYKELIEIIDHLRRMLINFKSKLLDV